MKDFRFDFYDKYVSKFKSSDMKADYKSTYEDIYSTYYLPILQEREKDDRILELGCGQGNFLDFLMTNGFSNLKGIDISEEQVKIARGRGINAEVANVFEFLEKTEDNYDIIVAIDFIEHFAKEELLRLFPKIYKTLTNKGQLILQTPNGMGLFPGQVIYGDLTHITIFNSGSLEQILKLFNFQNIKFYDTHPIPKNFKGMVQLFLWKVVTFLAYLIRKIETGKSQQLWTENIICSCEKLLGV